ncbi:hypothetical protein C1I97_22745 [Streptomyces sp. NTH33]|uniref:hypothetical protein n=1 Tax=Streptomyces sp. NTH33 TaxID=1735453 RepID=UPI000DA6F079|nr:hypothetical protein [Streptomyces sp. NTH33]PZH01009.1 hypothetical protein C1I97_22745 [Streptomyces sp. NTH33]
MRRPDVVLGMTPKNARGPVIAHLAAVRFTGSALTGLQLYTVTLALFAESTAVLVIALAAAASLAVAAFAVLGAMARPIVPLTRRTRARRSGDPEAHGIDGAVRTVRKG